MSLASSSGDRVGSVLAEGAAVMSLTGASGRWGLLALDAPAIHQRNHAWQRYDFLVGAGLRYDLSITRLVQS